MKYLFTVLIALLSGSVYAQQPGTCAEQRTGSFQSLLKTSSATPEEDWYNVTYVSFDLSMTHLSTAISGTVITKALVTVPTLSVYAFELDTSLVIDSVLINGQKLTVATSGKNIRKVTLPLALNQGATLTAQVTYHGQPASGSGFFTKGLNHFSLPSGTNITYTLGDMYYASEWWPCKQDIRDKIDSMDMRLTVPSVAKGCSNGVLTNTVTVSPALTRYEWKHRFPIKYYLITAAIAPYTEQAYTMYFTPTDSMRIRNFVYDISGINPESQGALDSVGATIKLFSGLFGTYPFATEKYGNCLVPLSGGMEHQTMTSLGYNTGALVTMHELGHQWWGDCVSQRNWKDIWLSEGWATYCEQLFLEYTKGAADAQLHRLNKHVNVTSTPGGRVLVDDTTNPYAVFDSRLVYDKGASVAHMLRYIAPADSLFFKACRQYQQTYRYGNAVTDDLKAVFETVYNQNLDSFFRQWVYGQGYPTYTLKWNYKAGQLYVQLRQTTSVPGSVPFFQMPVTFQVVTSSGSQLVQAQHSQSTQLFTFPVADSVRSIRLDPQDHILKRRGLASRDATLQVSAAFPEKTLLEHILIYPNPADQSWQIKGIPLKTTWELTDLSGKRVSSGRTSSESLLIPARALPSGTYLFRAAGLDTSFRLLRP
jgi:aminopeptidase N